MRPQSIEPAADPRWPQLVAAANGLVFHHPAWLELVAGHYRYELLACCLADDQDRLVAGLPLAAVSSRLTGRRLVAFPFSDACAPLYATADPAARALLAEAVRDEARRRGVDAEVRGTLESAAGAWEQVRYVRHVVPLASEPAAVLARASSSMRRGARKGERLGVRVRRSIDRRALEAFYRLHLVTRRRQGVPTQSKRFVLGLQGLFDRGLGFVALAEHDGDVLAAAVFLRTGPNLVYKYGASDPASLGMRPNNVLFARVMEWSSSERLERLDLGRTDLDNEGLRAFKRGLGADEEELPYTYLASHPPSQGDGRLARVVGRGIRVAPPVVGRAVGALLYRHFG